MRRYTGCEHFPGAPLGADPIRSARPVAGTKGVSESTGGVSDAVGYADFGRAYRQAGEALATARKSGESAVYFADAGSGLATLFADQGVQDFAAGVLRPLVEADRSALVPTLRAWLAHNGQWDSAAAELGVHRHTVRARIARAGELLGKDLTAADSADARMELWFALRVREGQ